MARLLGSGETNLMRIHDPVSGGAVGLLYRRPTTSERADYLASLLRREGDSATSALLETRRRFGLAIMCGLAEGDFEVSAEGEEPRPLSSQEGSPGYDPRWKEVVAESAPELVEALAYHVFEGCYAAPRRPAVGDASKKK
jgi:hypothetical protein